MTDAELASLLDDRDVKLGRKDAVRVLNCVAYVGGVAKLQGVARSFAIRTVKNLGAKSADILVGAGVLVDDRRECPRCRYRFLDDE
jgi:hypothetical protein